jgi:hypothetical protein
MPALTSSNIISEGHMMSDAIIPLISSIIGGVLVLAGAFFAKRAEDRRVWLIRLQEAAGDLATSYFQEVATINDARRAGADKSSVPAATYVVDRQKALGRFRTLPWSGEFEAQRQQMGMALDRVWQAWGDTDDAFEAAHKDARATVVIFTQAVGTHILQRGAGR